MKAGLFGSILRTPSVRREEREVTEKSREMLTYVGLGRTSTTRPPRTCPTATSGAWRSLGRSPPEPKLLLLDEPTAGMNPQESQQLTEFMDQLRRELDLTILLIEHDMKVVMGVSEHIWVLDHGEKIAEGEPEEIRANDRVIEAYLGKQESEG